MLIQLLILMYGTTEQCDGIGKKPFFLDTYEKHFQEYCGVSTFHLGKVTGSHFADFRNSAGYSDLLRNFAWILYNCQELCLHSHQEFCMLISFRSSAYPSYFLLLRPYQSIDHQSPPISLFKNFILHLSGGPRRLRLGLLPSPVPPVPLRVAHQRQKPA